MQCGCGQRHWGRFGAAGLLLADGLDTDELDANELDTDELDADELDAGELDADRPAGAGDADEGVAQGVAGSQMAGSEVGAGTVAAGGVTGSQVQAGGSVVLQHRAPWSHHGDTWGIPGGARNSEETAVQAAVREAGEEAGVHGPVRPHATHELAHPDWSYTTVLARAPARLAVRATDAESVEVRWHPIERVTELPLLGAFEAAWPLLRQMLATRAVLVVDAANVVGSRPDGWWRDRAGATSRLTRRLSVLAQQGVPAGLLDLPGHTWWPAVVVVTEGRARAAADAPGVEVIRAEADGDDTIVHVVREAGATGSDHHSATAGATGDEGGHDVSDDVGDEGACSSETATDSGAGPSNTGSAPRTVRTQVSVVTADRELRRRVVSAGARVVGPGSLWRVLDALPH